MKNSSECPCPQLHQQRVCINKSLAPVAVFRQCWIFRLRPLIHNCPALILPTPLTFYHLWIYLIAHSHVTVKVIKKNYESDTAVEVRPYLFSVQNPIAFPGSLVLELGSLGWSSLIIIGSSLWTLWKGMPASKLGFSQKPKTDVHGTWVCSKSDLYSFLSIITLWCHSPVSISGVTLRNYSLVSLLCHYQLHWTSSQRACFRRACSKGFQRDFVEPAFGPGDSPSGEPPFRELPVFREPPIGEPAFGKLSFREPGLGELSMKVSTCFRRYIKESQPAFIYSLLQLTVVMIYFWYGKFEVLKHNQHNYRLNWHFYGLVKNYVFVFWLRNLVVFANSQPTPANPGCSVKLRTRPKKLLSELTKYLPLRIPAEDTLLYETNDRVVKIAIAFLWIQILSSPSWNENPPHKHVWIENNLHA